MHDTDNRFAKGLRNGLVASLLAWALIFLLAAESRAVDDQRRHADDDHRASEMWQPQVHGGGRARVADFLGKIGHARIIECANHLVAGGQARTRHASGDHGGIT